MKTFNFNLAEQGAPVCTGSGRIVIIDKTDNDGDYPITGRILNSGSPLCECWTEDGLFDIDHPDGTKDWSGCAFDLFMLDYEDLDSPLFYNDREYFKGILDDFYIPYYKW